MGISSRTLRDRLSDRPTFITALTTASEGRFVPVPGGVLIRAVTREDVQRVAREYLTADRRTVVHVVKPPESS